jgi:mannose-1-phosphate guanylyltransferase
MEKASNHYILIMCGGSGPRLWPLSRSPRPKQFLELFSSRSLIQETVDRFSSFIPLQNIYIISHQKYIDRLKKVLKSTIPSRNYLAEPQKKNTAMAVLYGSIVIKKHNPQATITVTPSDHFVGNSNKFKRDITKAYSLANDTQSIVTVGIVPTYPNPGFGYILPGSQHHDYYTVSKFVEKPSEFDAQVLIKKNAFWNSGIYTFSANTILIEFKLLQPDYYQLIDKLSGNHQLLRQAYQLPLGVSIDKAISENSKSLVVIPATFDWSDVGEWYAIWLHIQKKSVDGIVHINNLGQHVSVNSKNCLIHSQPKKLIGLIGINNLAIIDTPDSLLVCNLHDTFSVRDLVKQIVDNPKLKKYFLKTNVPQ